MSQLLYAIDIVVVCVAGWKLLELLDKGTSRQETTQPELRSETQARVFEQTALVLARAIAIYGSPETIRRAIANVTLARLEGLLELHGPKNSEPTSVPEDPVEYTLSI